MGAAAARLRLNLCCFSSALSSVHRYVDTRRVTALTRTVMVAICAVVVALTVAPRASAFEVGDDLTGLPQIDQAFSDARGYWQGRQPTCPTGIRVTVADLAGEGEAGQATDCALALDLTWLNSSPDRTQYCALFSHEYGHLLGYGHEDRAEDVDKVMSQRVTPRYCRTFGEFLPKLPRPCSWPTWARATPTVRTLYAAGRRHAALVAFRSWRKRHPKARLPGPCVLT